MTWIWLKRRVVKLILGITSAILIAQSSAFGALPKVIRLSHINSQQPFDNGTAAMAAVFKSLVEVETNGSIEVEIYSDGQMGNESESISQVSIGVIQSCITTSGAMSSFYPLYSVLEIPFAIPNYSVAWKVLDGPFGQWMKEDILKTTGLRVLGFGEAGGFFQLTNNRRPIRNVKDMKGMRFRIMTLPIHQSILKAYGTESVSTSWGETYSSLKTGIADGQPNPIPIILEGKLYEVQKYLTITNHLYSTYCWIIDDKFYKSLDDHERSVVNSAAEAAIVAGRGINRIIEATERGLPSLVYNGMKVNKLTVSAEKEFKEIAVETSMAFIEENFGEKGKEMVRRFFEAIEEASKTEEDKES